MNAYIYENIVEIAMQFGTYMASGKFSDCTEAVSRSDQLKDYLPDWGEEFEKSFDEENEYLLEISRFADEKFKEQGWLKEDSGLSSKVEPKELTAGLLSEIATIYNIPRLKEFVSGRPESQVLSLLNRNDYFALKLWQEDDIKAVLDEMGYPCSEENVATVLASGDLDALSDCTDNDWNIISNAIRNQFL